MKHQLLDTLQFRKSPYAMFILVALLVVGCAPPEVKRPNVLLIVVDTLRADRLGAYGSHLQASKAIDRFFLSAVQFEDAQAASSWTLPSMASLMTSLYSSTHQCSKSNSRLDSSFKTLAEILQDNGYLTAAIVSHFYFKRKFGFHQGFMEYDQSLVHPLAESHDAISSPAVTNKAIDFLKKKALDQPWFLWAHYFDPHATYFFHENHSTKFGSENESDLYNGEIAFTDQQIGRLLDMVDELGFRDNTIVAFVSDHGEEFMEHGRRYHGNSLFKEVLQVPFAIRAPGFEPRRVAPMVRLVDFSPTLLDLLQILPPKNTPMVGRSLVPSMRGEAQPPIDALAELRLRNRADANVDSYILNDWKLVVETPKPVDPKARLPKTGPPPITKTTYYLFDRRQDPLEKGNVAKEFPNIVASMEKRMRQLIRAAKALKPQLSECAKTHLSQKEIDQLKGLGYISAEDQDL